MNNVHDLLPENVSDEAAYHIANFMMELSLAIEMLYYTQASRYAKKNALDLFPYNLLQPETTL